MACWLTLIIVGCIAAYLWSIPKPYFWREEDDA